MRNSPIFLCLNCGSDTLVEPHKRNCSVAETEAARQTREKCKELGIVGNLELFGIPRNATGDP